MKYKIRVNQTFIDKKTGSAVRYGSIFETVDRARLLDILNRGLGELVAIEHPKKPGKRVLFFQTVLYKIGGIETASKNIAKTFRNKNIVFCFAEADQNQLLEIGKYCDVLVDDGHTTYEVDVAVLMYYDAQRFLPRIKAKKIYHQIHADFAALKQFPNWKSFQLTQPETVDKMLAVSDTAKKGLKSAFGIESVVVPNILSPPDEKRLVFLVLSRPTIEKGFDKVLELARRFDDAGKDFVIYICTSTEQIKNPEKLKHRRIVLVEPSIYNDELLRSADYLVQLSHNESYCYSVREALQRQVPVLVSRIPEFEKLVKDGVNGYIIDEINDDVVDKIFNDIPKPKAYKEKTPAIWNKVLKGEL